MDEDTLIYFTSDHGTHIDHKDGTDGGSNGNFKGGKGIDPLEGGIRIPGILRWPKMIVPKTELDIPTSLLDFRETINEIISRNVVTSVSGGGNLSTDGIRCVT